MLLDGHPLQALFQPEPEERAQHAPETRRQSDVRGGALRTRIIREDAPLDLDQADQLFASHLSRHFAHASGD